MRFPGLLVAGLLIGTAAKKIEAQIGGSVRLIHCGTLRAAVEYGAVHAERGDTVLLAPACARYLIAPAVKPET